MTAKQHFVPKFYLRAFANAAGNLHVFDVENLRILSPRGPRRVCYEHFFYAGRTGEADETAQEVEDFLAKCIEDPISKAVHPVIAQLRDGARISAEEKYALAALMCGLWLRGPAMRHGINSLSEQALKFRYKMLAGHPRGDDLLDRAAKDAGMELSADEQNDLRKFLVAGDYDLVFPNTAHLDFMIDADNLRGFANLFCAQQWIIHLSHCDRQFVTSDNPVVAVAPPREGFYGPAFLERTHFFALTPTIAIEAKCPEEGQKGGVELLPHAEGDEGAIDRVNLNVASQARYLYAARPDEIEWFGQVLGVASDE